MGEVGHLQRKQVGEKCPGLPPQVLLGLFQQCIKVKRIKFALHRGRIKVFPIGVYRAERNQHYNVRPHFSITGFSNGPARQRWSRAATLVKSYREAHPLSPPCRVFGCENASQLALLSSVPETLRGQGGHVPSPRAPQHSPRSE